MEGDEAFQSSLQAKLSQSLSQRRKEFRLRDLKASPAGSVDFSSNDFLSLSTSAALRAQFLSELADAAPQLGSTGSRLLDGNSTYSETLERDIAAFHHGPAGLLANSGFDANVGIFSCLPQPGDVILYDELIHASVHDGMRLSRAGRRLPFAHNSVADLRAVLAACLAADALLKDGRRSVFVAVESVYSMEGDLAPLAEFLDVMEELCPRKNAHMIVDEAHATGLYGCNGNGRVCELGLENRVFVRLHTFGKALACNGAIIICTPLTRLYLINYARPLIYTTFMSYPSLAAIRASYTFMASGQTQQLTTNLFHLIRTLHTALLSLASARTSTTKKTTTFPPSSTSTTSPSPFPPSSTNLITIPPLRPLSPIFALFTPFPRDLAAYCQAAGFVVRAVVPPTVPEGTERVRVCLHAGNTEAEVVAFVRLVGRWVESRACEDKAAKAQPTGAVVGGAKL